MALTEQQKNSIKYLQDRTLSGVRGTQIAAGQSYDPPGRWVLVETAGTVTGRLVMDEADLTYTLPVGIVQLAFKSITSVAGGFVGKLIQ